MTDLNFVLLYVKDPLASAAFYAGLFGHQPVESTPGFAMFVLKSGLRIGLWAAHDVKPAATPAGGTELCFVVPDLDAVFADWTARGIGIAQPPVKMDFGYTFTGLDPDGHRLRVMLPHATA